MPQRRPTSVLVIAIFHFLLGGLGLMCNLFGMVGQLAGGGSGAMFQTDPRQAQMQRDMEKAMETAAPSNKPVQILNAVASVCLSSLLLVAGFGLVNMAPWGRSLSLAYGYMALIEKLGMGLYVIMVTLPAMGAMMQPMLAQAKSAQERQIFEITIGAMKIGGFVGILFPLIYPFVVLIVMNMASVKAAFQEAALPEEKEEPDFTSDQPFRSNPDDRFKT